MENFILPESPVYSYFACLEMVDEVRHYVPGGFHPVLIGDILASRFKVVNKLGCSTEATVWLCRDLGQNKWRAIKVYAADFSHEDLASVKLVQPNPEQLSIFATSLEHFWVVGPNGRHFCAVQPLLGPSISHVSFYYRNEPLFLKNLCQQMAKAVHLLHKKRLYHGRLNPNNFRFLVKDTIHKLSEEEMSNMVDDPELFRVVQTVGWQHRDTKALLWVSADYENNGNNDSPDYDNDSESDYHTDSEPVLCDCSRDRYRDVNHVPTCHTLDNPSLPANVPKYVVSETWLSLSDSSSDANGRQDAYVMRNIALADLDACIRHTPNSSNSNNNNNTTTTTPIPLRTIRLPTGYTAPETWATAATDPNPLTSNSNRTNPAAAADVWSLAAAMYTAVCGTDPFRDSYRFSSCVLPALANYLGAPPPGAIDGWVAGWTVSEDSAALARRLADEGEKEYQEEVRGRREMYDTGDALEEQMMVRLRWLAAVTDEQWLKALELGGREWYDDAWDDEGERVMGKEDIRLFADLLGKMFKWRPEDRISMEEVMNHPWIRDGEE